MRVVVYTDAEGTGGAEISLGHLVRTVSPNINLSVLGVSPEVVETIAQNRPDCQALVLSKTLLDHRRTFAQLRPDVIHANLCAPWACARGLLAAISVANTRVVRVDQLPLRTTDLWTWGRTRWLSLRVDARVAVGQTSSRQMEDFYALGRHSVISIPNGVPDVAGPEPDYRSGPELHVGSVGRLDPMKGHDVLLRAIAQVPRLKLTILGEGAYRPALEQLATELGIAERVSFPGWTDEVRSRLLGFDIIAHPSRSEGFPLSVVEAMLTARPVIATRVGSIPEAIQPERSGLLVEKDDIDGLAQALCRLQRDRTLRQHLGRTARQRAACNFTVQRMTQQYEALWAKLLTRPRAPRLRVPRPQD